MEQTQEEIWHCPNEPDRELAALMVGCLKPNIWHQIAQHFQKPYPYTLAEKFDLVYRLLGCKK